jgi:hypothetical protein
LKTDFVVQGVNILTIQMGKRVATLHSGPLQASESEPKCAARCQLVPPVFSSSAHFRVRRRKRELATHPPVVAPRAVHGGKRDGARARRREHVGQAREIRRKVPDKEVGLPPTKQGTGLPQTHGVACRLERGRSGAGARRSARGAAAQAHTPGRAAEGRGA